MRITRHEFLRLTGLATGAAILGACAPQQAAAPQLTVTSQPTVTPQPTMTPQQVAKETQTVEPTKTTQQTVPQVGLYMTEPRTISSSLLGRDYQLAVQVPEDYASSSDSYPVIYVLDGDIFFGMAANMTPILHLIDGVPEMIVVGITYPMHSYDELWSLRELDYKIPEAEGAPWNSHADKFLSALKQEFIPFIEKNYRVDRNQRTLYGYSSSGFFVLYALSQEPGLFRYFLSGSGDLDSAVPYFLAHDQKLASHEKNDPITLYLTIGSYEDGTTGSSVNTFNKFVEAFKAKNYPGLQLTTDIYTGESHGSGGAALTYFKGLRNYIRVRKP